MPKQEERGYVIRPTSSIVAFWVAVAVLLVVVGVPLFTADWHTFGFVLPLSLFLAWVLWIVLLRPGLRYDAAKAVVTNIGRTHTVPWPRVAGVRQRLNVVFELDTGKSIEAWGAPYPRKRSNVLNGFSKDPAQSEYDFDQRAELLESFRKAAPASDEPVRSRWDVVPLLIGLVLAIAVVLELTLGR